MLIEVLAPIYLRSPTREEWIDICNGYLKDWNFPNCVGAVDGKHFWIQAPPNSGSLYYNYKKTFSIVLMATCDHNYKFTLVDVGSYGSNNDAGIFSRSEFGKALLNETLNLPRGVAKLPESEIEIPCFFVGDEAFQLTKNMMRPYSGRGLDEKKTIFNYRLSRARRTIENAFGILVSRWRVFRKPICMQPTTVDNIIMACICLHNFLKTENDLLSPQNRRYCPNNFVDIESQNGEIRNGEWRNETLEERANLRPTRAHRATREAYNQRDSLANYFLTPAGEVPWQYAYIHRSFNSQDPPEN